jgi:hypothetical protein
MIPPGKIRVQTSGNHRMKPVTTMMPMPTNKNQ